MLRLLCLLWISGLSFLGHNGFAKDVISDDATADISRLDFRPSNVGGRPFPWRFDSRFHWEDLDGFWASQNGELIVFRLDVVRREETDRVIDLGVMDLDAGNLGSRSFLRVPELHQVMITKHMDSKGDNVVSRFRPLKLEKSCGVTYALLLTLSRTDSNGREIRNNHLMRRVYSLRGQRVYEAAERCNK